MALLIDTCTTRDLLRLLFPEHEQDLHSVIHAVYEKLKTKLTLSCSCGQLLVVKELDCKKVELNIVDVVDRLKKLGKFEQVKIDGGAK